MTARLPTTNILRFLDECVSQPPLLDGIRAISRFRIAESVSLVNAGGQKQHRLSRCTPPVIVRTALV